MSDIPAELSLDVTAALAAIDQIESALSAAAASFQSSIDSSLSALDIPAVDVPVEFDTSSLDTLDASLAEASSGVVVPVEGDTAPAVEAISSLDGEIVTVGVEADTSQAQAEVEQLGGAVSGAGSSLANFGANARVGFDAAGAAVTGNVTKMTGALGTLGPQAAGAAAAVGTLVVVGKSLVGSALDAEAAVQRFNTTLGVAADTVLRIDVGGLNVDLRELALSLGSDDEAALNAASSIFQLGVSAGGTREEVAQTTKEIEALAARAVALDPSLGQVGDVAERLLTGLARGGRFASQFKISLTSAEITAEALRENIGKTADELTLYDKAAAGATLATQRLGGSLSADIAKGSQNVAIQFAVVRQAFQETLETTGKPLLGPTLDLLKDAQPALTALAEAFGTILQVVIPLADAILSTLVPALEALTPLLDLAAKGAGLLGTAFKISLLPVTGPLKLIEGGVHAVQGALDDTTSSAVDGGKAVADALLAVDSLFQGLGQGLKTGEELSASFKEVESAVAPVTAAEAQLRAETTRLAVALANGTASERDFRRAFLGSGLDVAAFTDSVKQVIAQRDALAASFNQGLPSIGDAFTVEASKVAASSAKIDRSFEQLTSAADTLRDRFTSNLPSIADAFTEGVSPEDLAKAQDTLEAFIQGVEGVSKSAADAAQAVIDKAAVEGGTGLAGFLEQLRKQSAEIAAFQGTLQTLRARGAQDLASTFAERGLDSAAIASEAAGLTDAQLAAAEQTVEQSKSVRNDAVKSMGLFADELVATFGPKGAEAGTVFGDGLVTSLSDPAIVEQARAAAAKIGEATTQGAASSVAAGPQTLSGFLAALKRQSGDIQSFQDDLNTIAANGGTVLADTLRQQGITAANAASQAAALAPDQLLAAEQAVRDAQTVLGNAEADNKAAADRLVQFMADTAARATAGFSDAFVVQVGPLLGIIGADILADTTLTTAMAAAGALGGAAYGASFDEAVRHALEVSTISGILLGGGTITPPTVAITAPPGGVANVQAGFGTATSPALDRSVPSVVVENINVTPPRDSTADEQANAISESLTWRLRGAR